MLPAPSKLFAVFTAGYERALYPKTVMAITVSEFHFQSRIDTSTLPHVVDSFTNSSTVFLSEVPGTLRQATEKKSNGAGYEKRLVPDLSVAPFLDSK